jgi:hypothetical protein
MYRAASREGLFWSRQAYPLQTDLMFRELTIWIGLVLERGDAERDLDDALAILKRNCF